MARTPGTASYYRYWGKAHAGEGAAAACHLLPLHSLDVAAVGWHLLAPERPLATELAARLDLPAFPAHAGPPIAS